MSLYLKYFKTRLIVSLQYKEAAIAGITTQFFWGLINAGIYVAFYKNTKVDVGINLKEIITYVWLTQSFLSLVWFRYKDQELFSQVRDGTIAYELCRPYNSYVWWYVKTLASKYAACALRCLPVLIVAFFLPAPFNLSLPASPLSFIIFLVTLVLGTILLTSMVMLVHIYSFYSVNAEGISNVLLIVAELLTGLAVPIPILPDVVQRFSFYLPFRFISDFSFRIYSGNIPITEGLTGIAFQIGWTIVLVAIGSYFMKRALKKVYILGG